MQAASQPQHSTLQYGQANSCVCRWVCPHIVLAGSRCGDFRLHLRSQAPALEDDLAMWLLCGTRVFCCCSLSCLASRRFKCSLCSQLQSRSPGKKADVSAENREGCQKSAFIARHLHIGHPMLARSCLCLKTWAQRPPRYVQLSSEGLVVKAFRMSTV